MADLFKPKTLKDRVFAGTFGNNSASIKTRTLAAAAIGDKVYFAIIPYGAVIHSVTLRNAALGASTQLSLGWEYKDGTAGGSATAFLTAGATATAGSREYTGLPVETDKDVVAYATVSGGAATGEVAVIIEYEYIGTE